MSKKTLISTILVAVIVISTLGVSYAYFTANMTGSESVSTIKVSGGRMEIAFAGTNSVDVKNAYPQATALDTKVFTLTGTNTTDQTMSYALKLVVDANGFSSNAISYTLTGSSQQSGDVTASKTNTGIANGKSTISLGTGSFQKTVTEAEPNKTVIHTYQLGIFFLDSGVPQNDEQGKSFAAHVTIVAA